MNADERGYFSARIELVAVGQTSCSDTIFGSIRLHPRPCTGRVASRILTAVSAAARSHRERHPGASMLGNKTNDQWVTEYSHSHQHPINRLCHTIGIPLIAGSILLLIVSIFVEGLWPIAVGLFLLGWILQFLGHYVEGKPPEFLRDWRFLFVGLRWWLAKIRGRA
jgi:hypothetical protein